MKKHYNITVRGRVQGVGFRHNAKRQADMLGLCGFARNVADGSVYMEAEGSIESLDEFVLWCHKGPGWSQVLDIKVSVSNIEGLVGFKAY